MTGELGDGWLTSRDARPVRVANRDGGSLFLLLGDHAGDCIPERLAGLGLAPAELSRHIALDIGVAALGAELAALLDAPFAEQRYSRLVIDCNRDPAAADSIAPVSDGTPIPGNRGLSAADRRHRREAIFDPYHDTIADLLAERAATGRETIIVSLHSFTPRLAGAARPWDVGVLHDGGDASFALTVLDLLRAHTDIVVGDNEPYRMDATDYTVPRHAYAAGLRYVEIEVRQDRLADRDGYRAMARLLHGALIGQ